MAAVTICGAFGAQKIKSVSVSTISPSICHEVMGPDAMILVFWMLSFKPTFSLSSFHFHQEALQFFFAFCHKCHLHIWGYWYFSWQSWFQLVLHPVQHFSWCTCCPLWRDQIANICWIIEKVRELKKKSASLTLLKPLTVWITTNCGISLKG